MLVAAAVCPHPPLLVPEVAAGAARELDPLRVAATEALEVVRAAGVDLLAVVGVEDTAYRRRPSTSPDRRMGGKRRPAWRAWPEGALGTFHGFGVPVQVTLGRPAPAAPGTHSSDSRLPLSLSVAAWLLRAAAWPTRVVGRSFVPDLPAGEYAAAGRLLSDAAERLGLLVMGDGSARRSERAPGYIDPRAADFDDAVVRALEAADVPGLSAIDGHLAGELLAAGWPSWQALAGAAGDGHWRGRAHYVGAPFGVGYTVASWTSA